MTRLPTARTVARATQKRRFPGSVAAEWPRERVPRSTRGESSTAKNGCSPATTYTGYTGTGYMDFRGSGTRTEWNNVNVATAGNYVLTFRCTNYCTYLGHLLAYPD